MFTYKQKHKNCISLLLFLARIFYYQSLKQIECKLMNFIRFYVSYYANFEQQTDKQTYIHWVFDLHDYLTEFKL